MPNTRVIYISEITTGSKFRTIATNTAKAKAAKKKGVHWSSCIVNDAGGNFQRPSFRDVANPAARRMTVWNASFGWITKWPPTFNIFNKPCPRAIGYHFPKANQTNYEGFSLIP